MIPEKTQLSFADLTAAYESDQRNRGVEHQRNVDAANDEIRRSFAAFTKGREQAERTQTEEVERRFKAIQEKALSTLVPLLKAWIKEDTRSATSAVAAAYAALEAEALQATGTPLRPNTIAFAFAEISLQSRPERKGSFANARTWQGTIIGVSLVEASHKAAQQMLSGNVAATRENLLAVEARVEASSYAPLTDSVNERWEAITCGGSATAIEAELARLDKIEQDKITAAGVAAWNEAERKRRERSQHNVFRPGPGA